MDIKGIKWSCLQLFDVAQDKDKYRALVNVVMNNQVP
jgi:hypothetical protein